jgi:NAD+ synthase (glutamine-hydrolysing)
VQAGLRTDYLFRLANQRRAFVLGTGDLSELALGWCTYGVGDHMSHYNVNGSLAKTLIQYLMRWVARTGQFDDATAKVILSIVDTEISPELVPADAKGTCKARSRWSGPTSCRTSTCSTSRVTDCRRRRWPSSPGTRGATPRASRGRRSFRKVHGMRTTSPRSASGSRFFLRRFFAESQFKRSALPNGPKVVSGGSLSPRGDWRAPSDGNANVWLAELEANVPVTESDG